MEEAHTIDAILCFLAPDEVLAVAFGGTVGDSRTTFLIDGGEEAVTNFKALPRVFAVRADRWHRDVRVDGNAGCVGGGCVSVHGFCGCGFFLAFHLWTVLSVFAGCVYSTGLRQHVAGARW